MGFSLVVRSPWFALLPLILPAHEHDMATNKAANHSLTMQELADCVDRSFQCPYWSGIGECDKNPRYMHVMCKPSCRMCPGDLATRSADLYRSLERQFVHDRLPVLSPNDEFLELSYDPRIFVFDDFLTDEECEFFKDYAHPHLQIAKTINSSSGMTQPDRARTNSQMYVSPQDCRDHPRISKVIQRMHLLARMPLGHAEQIQVGRYKEGQYYEPHFDSEPKQGVIRTATVLAFIHEPEQGGETIFPKRKACAGEDFSKCCEDIPGVVIGEGGGVVIRGKKRQAVLFYSHDTDGRHNIFGTHASCPVRSGEKWILQQWFRSKPYDLSPHRAAG